MNPWTVVWHCIHWNGLRVCGQRSWTSPNSARSPGSSSGVVAAPLPLDADLAAQGHGVHPRRCALLDPEPGSLSAVAAVVRGLQPNPRVSTRAASGLLLATDVADYLVALGVPFRDAHEIVGSVVRRLVKEGRSFDDLSLAQWREHSALFGEDIRGAITARASVEKKRTPQSTAPDAVAAALREAKEWLRAQGL